MPRHATRGTILANWTAAEVSERLARPTPGDLRGPLLPRMLWSAARRVVPGMRRVAPCLAETPLPADAVVERPDPDVPRAMAAFSGVWNGAWAGVTGQPGLCQTLVVERVHPLGFADVISSHGAAPAWGVEEPGCHRVSARITTEGRLYFRARFGRRYTVCMLDGDRLRASLRGQGHALLARTTLAEMVAVTAALPLAAPAAGAPRRQLTLAQLRAEDADPTLLHFGHFAPPDNAAPARAMLEGRLTIGPIRFFRSVRGVRGVPLDLPLLTLDFATSAEEIIPAGEDILRIPTANRLNRLILSPGRIWSEPGDSGWSRACLPFVLTSDISNEAHQGVAVFAFDGIVVSRVRMQISQETNPWREVDLVAHAAAHFEPRPVAGKTRLLAARRRELAARWPLRPWQELPRSPDQPPPAGFDATQPAGCVSASGLLVGEALFLHACDTRTGPFPLPEDLRMAAFSVSKSLAGLVLFWLAEAHGANVPEERVLAHLKPPRDAAPEWAQVTFRDLLDMVSGLGSFEEGAPSRPFADEAHPLMLAWSEARTAAAKLGVAVRYGALPWGRGRVFRYNSTFTFVLAAAMDGFLKAREGRAANLWDRFTDAVLTPMGIPSLPMMHTDEPDGSRGIPLLATGAYPTLAQTARIAWLLLHGGRFEGQQLVSAAEVRRALDWSGAPVTGVPAQADMLAHNGTYCGGFWRAPWRTAGDGLVTAVSMQGYGGNAVVLLPNNTACLRFADGQVYTSQDMIRTAEAVRGFGPTTPGLRGSPLPPGRRLEGPELVAAVLGNTIVSHAGDWLAFCGAKGRLYLGRVYQDPVVGRWTIAQGRLLQQFESATAHEPLARWALFENLEGVVLLDEITGRVVQTTIERGMTARFGP